MKPQPYILGMVLVGLTTVGILSYLYIQKPKEKEKEKKDKDE
tara:strand:- start:1228 stop:1353 length:126 start_codon:yes stop_codon:yes gene_type:complete